MTDHLHDDELERVFQDLAPIAVRAGDPRSSEGPHRAKNVRLAAELVVRLGIVEKMAEWRSDDPALRPKGPGGRPAELCDAQVLGLLLLHTLAGESFSVTELNTTMRERLDPVGLKLLGLPEPDLDEHPKVSYYRLRRAARRFAAPIDSAPYSTGRRLTDKQVAEIVRKRAEIGEEVLEERARRAGWVMGQLLHATWLAVPKKYRGRWSGTLCVDATVVPTWGKKGTPRVGRAARTHSPEMDAAWYVREETDHADKGGKKGKRTLIYGYETHVVVASGEGEFPRLALAATLDRPGHRIAKNALACVAQVAGRELPAGWFAGDLAYLPNSKEADLQGPLRALGYRLVFDYRVDQLGIQGQHAGALLVEGIWYCPSMPKTLIDASLDYRAGRIGEETYRARIAARKDYQLQVKQKADDNGTTQMRCPAMGESATVDCPLKPRKQKSIGLGIPKLRTPIINRPEHPDKVCANHSSVAFGPDAGLKYRQDVPYGTPEWERLYHGPRNTIEGFNGMFKDENHADAASAGKRRARGFTWHWLTTTLNLMATNLRRLRDFLNEQADQARRPSPTSPDKRRCAKRLADYRPDPNAPPVTGPAAP